MTNVDIVTVRDLIAALNALPEDQKDLPVQYVTTVTVSNNISSVTLGPADYGQQINIS